jgi:hypothetical protein
MLCSTPIGVLNLKRKTKSAVVQEAPEPIFGGYANGRGEIFLFGADIVYRVNFKYNSVQKRPQLNSGAQALYDVTEPGEPFEYCKVSFRRLSSAQIIEICSSGSFSVTPRLIK